MILEIYYYLSMTLKPMSICISLVKQDDRLTDKLERVSCELVVWGNPKGDLLNTVSAQELRPQNVTLRSSLTSPLDTV